jgi:hypothetical protein
MRHIVVLVASFALAVAVVAPATAAPPERSSYATYWTNTKYVSSLDPYAADVYSELTIRFATGQTRTADGRSTFSILDIFASGFRNDPSGVVFIDPWEGGYSASAQPADPSLGGVEPSLAQAWAYAGPLTFVCYQGPCPALPSPIDISVEWVATGPATVTSSHPVDDIGGVSSMVVRSRPADVTVDVTGGHLPLPSILVGSTILWQMQVYRGPKS